MNFDDNATINEAISIIIDEIVVKELKDCYDNLQEPISVPRFSFDKIEEAKQTKKLAKALKRVAEHYGAETNEW